MVAIAAMDTGHLHPEQGPVGTTADDPGRFQIMRLVERARLAGSGQQVVERRATGLAAVARDAEVELARCGIAAGVFFIRALGRHKPPAGGETGKADGDGGEAAAGSAKLAKTSSQ
ncbi:hypothetical protein GCM10020258_37120 [Sphingomonas yabuuchiae]